MSKRKDKALKAHANIRRAITMTRQVIPLAGYLSSVPQFSLQISASPFEFLIDIITKDLQIGESDIRNWLGSFLVNNLYAIEMGVKAILLSRLKSMISCSVDPRIPSYMRLGESDSKGIVIDINAIDIFGKLHVSPLSKEGKNLYFGIGESGDIGKLARAKDFDAFLWFVMHCGKFPNSGQFDGLHTKYTVSSIVPDANPQSIFNGVYATPKSTGEQDKMRMVVGSTFVSQTWGKGSCVAMCNNVTYDDEGKAQRATVIPISSNLESVNWYYTPMLREANLVKYNKSVVDDHEDYELLFEDGLKHEKPLCNLTFRPNYSDDDNAMVSDKIILKILPQPQIKGIKRVNFDRDGKFSLLGFCSATEGYTVGPEVKTFTGDSGERYIDVRLKGTITDADALHKSMYACYNGLSVYEFNYDYIMSMQLFDGKCVAENILQWLLGYRVGFDFSTKENEILERVSGIIQHVLQKDETLANDCYFSFDNTKYAEMLEKTARKKANMETFGENSYQLPSFDTVEEILNEYQTDTDPHKKEEIISRAFKAASITYVSSVGGNSTMEFNFMVSSLKGLLFSLVQSLLSPKVLMLLEVNYQLMGGSNEKATFEDILEQMGQIIFDIVLELRDMIIAELLKLVIDALTPTKEIILNALLKEQADEYIAIIQDMIANASWMFWMLKGLFRNQLEDTRITDVSYADIDNVFAKEVDKPQTNC